MFCQSHLGVQLVVGLLRIYVDSSITKEVHDAPSLEAIVLSYFKKQERWSGMDKMNASKICNIMRSFAQDHSINSLELVLKVFIFQGILNLHTRCFLLLISFHSVCAEHLWFMRA